MGEATSADLVRTGDKDIFLATLFVSELAQPHVFALHAFAIDVASIPSRVSEPQIGEIRLQWWADTLDAIAAGEAQSHPVARQLAVTIGQHRLPIAPLQGLVEARRADLYADVPDNLTMVEAYFGATCSVLFQLSCLIINPVLAAQAATASGLAGVAFGLSRALLSPEAMAKLTPEGSSRDELLSLAQLRLDEARSAIARLPGNLLPAFLPVSIAVLNLAAAKDGQLSVSQWRKQWQLWRAARLDKI